MPFNAPSFPRNDSTPTSGSIGPADNILKLRSPLVLSKDDADYFLGTLDEVLP